MPQSAAPAKWVTWVHPSEQSRFKPVRQGRRLRAEARWETTNSVWAIRSPSESGSEPGAAHDVASTVASLVDSTALTQPLGLPAARLVADESQGHSIHPPRWAPPPRHRLKS